MRLLSGAAPILAILLAVAGAPPAVPAIPERTDELWEPPLGHPLRISRAYALPNGPYRAGHRGIDLPTATGEPVRSPAAGTVTFVGEVVDRPVISIRVDERTLLSMEPVTSALRAGDAVGRGETIGEVAGAGHCETGCLHLGVRVDGAYVNPLRFLRPRPVLLPW